MDIRGRRTWCADCTAPIVLPENVPLVECFLDALPAWQGAGALGAPVMEGFDRAQVRALLDLRAVPEPERPLYWQALSELEAEFRAIRAARAEGERAARSQHREK